jgi:hypothetical protein
MHVRNILAWGVFGLLGGGASWLLSGSDAIANPTDLSITPANTLSATINHPTHLSPVDLAQVNNADLACYLHSLDGQQYDLSALCSQFEAVGEEVVLQTGDVQVTLRWNTADDLDLFVRDPAGDEVSYFNPSVPSGGQLDVDANMGCVERMASPVENIFWPTGGGVPGDYVVTVDLFSYCGPEVPIDFTLTTLVQGQVQTQTGTVSAGQTSVSFPFSYVSGGVPAGGSSSSAANPTAAEASSLPMLPVSN